MVAGALESMQVAEEASVSVSLYPGEVVALFLESSDSLQLAYLQTVSMFCFMVAARRVSAASE